MGKKVIVSSYDESWKQAFEDIRKELAEALGDLALSIEHVGSTSVEGLSAKPIIDIDVVIENESKLEAVIEAFGKIGYRHEGNLGIPGREAFKYEGKEHLMRHHLYVCVEDASELKRHISFRDYLCSHPDAVREYSRIKEEGAKLFPEDMDKYIEHKSPFIESIYKKIGLISNPQDVKNEIKTERLIIRPVEQGDAEAIHIYAGSPDIDMMMFLPNETIKETEGFINFARSEWEKEEPEDREYVILLDGEIIGGVNLEKCENVSDSEIDNKTGNNIGYEIGWIIRQDKRGQGFATEAAKALMSYAFNELKADYVQAHCDSRNAASEGVMKKLGMTLIDGTGTRFYPKTGVTSGEYLYSVDKAEYMGTK